MGRSRKAFTLPSLRRAATPSFWRCPTCPSPQLDQRPGRFKRPEHRRLGSPPSAPSRPCIEVSESPENQTRSAASGCATRPSPPASPNPGRGIHCAVPPGPGFSSHRPRRYGADLQFYQPLCGETNYLVHKIGITGILYGVSQVHHVVSHRRSSRAWVGVSNQTLTGNLR